MRESDGRNCAPGYSALGNGKVLLQDDMEGLLKWGNIPGWPTVTAVKWGTQVYGGSSCLRIFANRDFPNGPVFGYTGRVIPSFSSGIIQAEVVVCSAAESLVVNPPIRVVWGAGIKLEWWDGVKRRITGFLYTRVDNTVNLFDENLYDDPIGDFYPGSDGLIWNRIWFKYDLGKDRYISAGVDGFKWDVSNHQAGSVDDATPVRANFMIGMQNYVPGRYFMYCDNAALVKVN